MKKIFFSLFMLFSSMNFSNANSTNDLINSALSLIDKNKPV